MSEGIVSIYYIGIRGGGNNEVIWEICYTHFLILIMINVFQIYTFPIKFSFIEYMFVF